MYDTEILIFVTVFAAALAALYLIRRFRHGGDTRARLAEIFNDQAIDTSNRSLIAWKTRLAHLAGLLTQLSVPSGTWQDLPERVRFMNAGLRSERAPVIFFASKTAITFLLPLISLTSIAMIGHHIERPVLYSIVVMSAGLGYFLPNFVLNRLIEARQKTLVAHFPDALDLITVCVEAGLSLDSAIDKVSTESFEKSPPLAEELHLVTLEMRAGSTRERALRNLALRTGTHDIGLLVAMLIQSERFGTSVSESLTVYAEVLRSKRAQNAEEEAAKVATKLLFPLMFCVFPAMLLVLMGPAMLNIYHSLMPTLTSGQ